MVMGGGWLCVGGGPSAGGVAGRFVTGGGSSVAGGAGSSVLGGGSTTVGGVGGSSMGGGSFAGVVVGSSVVGGSASVTVGGIGSLVIGGGVSVLGRGDDVVGSLGVGGGFSVAGGAFSSVILLGELLVLRGGNASREGSRIACGAADSFVDGGAVLDVGRVAAGTGAGPALADRLVAISRSLSPAHGILEPAAVTPARALLSVVSASAPISATACLTTTSRGWPMTSSMGWLMGLSLSGASQERSEVIPTAAATTPAPASVYQRPTLPRRPRRLIRAARRTRAFTPRSSSFSLRTSCFSAGFRMSSAPLPLTAVVGSCRGLVDLLVARSVVGRVHLDRGAGVFEGEVVGL